MIAPDVMVVEASSELAATYFVLLGLFVASAVGILFCTCIPVKIRNLLLSFLGRASAASGRTTHAPERRVYPFAIGQDPWHLGWIHDDEAELDAERAKRRR